MKTVYKEYKFYRTYEYVLGTEDEHLSTEYYLFAYDEIEALALANDECLDTEYTQVIRIEEVTDPKILKQIDEDPKYVYLW